MDPLSQGASGAGIQDYVAKMEAGRGLDQQVLPSRNESCVWVLATR